MIKRVFAPEKGGCRFFNTMMVNALAATIASDYRRSGIDPDRPTLARPQELSASTAKTVIAHFVCP